MKHDLMIDPVYEFEGGGNLMAYASKGTHSPEDFLAELEAGFGLTASPVDVQHALQRNLPDGSCQEVYQPGCGVYPVTLVDAENLREAVTKIEGKADAERTD